MKKRLSFIFGIALVGLTVMTLATSCTKDLCPNSKPYYCAGAEVCCPYPYLASGTKLCYEYLSDCRAAGYYCVTCTK